VHPTQLRNGARAFAEDPQHAFPGQGQMKPEQLAALLHHSDRGSQYTSEQFLRLMPTTASYVR
jgi:transposase InsO family protein